MSCRKVVSAKGRAISVLLGDLQRILISFEQSVLPGFVASTGGFSSSEDLHTQCPVSARSQCG